MHPEFTDIVELAVTIFVIAFIVLPALCWLFG